MDNLAIVTLGYNNALGEMKAQYAGASDLLLNVVSCAVVAYVTGDAGVGTVDGKRIDANAAKASIIDTITASRGTGARRSKDLAMVALELARKTNKNGTRKAILGAASHGDAVIFVRSHIANDYNGADTIDALKLAMAGIKPAVVENSDTDLEKVQKSIASKVKSGGLTGADIVALVSSLAVSLSYAELFEAHKALADKLAMVAEQKAEMERATAPVPVVDAAPVREKKTARK